MGLGLASASLTSLTLAWAGCTTAPPPEPVAPEVGFGLVPIGTRRAP